jgi:hypothetical protein
MLSLEFTDKTREEQFQLRLLEFFIFGLNLLLLFFIPVIRIAFSNFLGDELIFHFRIGIKKGFSPCMKDL